MTRVDFYILGEQEPDQRLLFACRLTEKAFHQGHTVHLHTSDAETATELDQLLWSFRPDSFVPHNLLSPDTEEEAVTIGHGEEPGTQHDLLINLDLQVPFFFSRFQRLAEVVVQDPDVVAATRKHYSFYKERGYPMNNHDLRRK